MGPEKVNDKQPSLLSRACRLPRKVADRVSELSDTLYKEHLQPLKANREIPYKFLAMAILLLMYLPSMLLLNYVIPPEVTLTSGNEVSNVTYCDTKQTFESGVTHATLLNNTPFRPGSDWEIDTHYSYPDYDINRYTSPESDGYHIECESGDVAIVFFSRRMQVPIFNYSDISILVEMEMVSGRGGFI
jgi:hypothetical protein